MCHINTESFVDVKLKIISKAVKTQWSQKKPLRNPTSQRCCSRVIFQTRHNKNKIFGIFGTPYTEEQLYGSSDMIQATI